MSVGNKGGSDALDRYLKKMGLNPPRIPETLKARFSEKFPYHSKKAQMTWCIKQLEAVKDLILDEVNSPRHLQMATLTQYAAMILKIRDTMAVRDGYFRGRTPRGNPLLQRTPEELTNTRNPLKGLLSDEQLAEIDKARKSKNNGTAQ